MSPLRSRSGKKGQVGLAVYLGVVAVALVALLILLSNVGEDLMRVSCEGSYNNLTGVCDARGRSFNSSDRLYTGFEVASKLSLADQLLAGGVVIMGFIAVIYWSRRWT